VEPSASHEVIFNKNPLLADLSDFRKWLPSSKDKSVVPTPFNKVVVPMQGNCMVMREKSQRTGPRVCSH
jgi:lysophospholipid acyltransferase (LPLAT)-like uncharacterized protein